MKSLTQNTVRSNVTRELIHTINYALPGMNSPPPGREHLGDSLTFPSAAAAWIFSQRGDLEATDAPAFESRCITLAFVWDGRKEGGV